MGNVAIVGSRDYPDLEQVRSYVRGMKLVQDEHGIPMRVVSGGARGVDAAAEEEAVRLGLEVAVFPAHWNRQPDGSYDKSAGFRRNKQIVEAADYVVAFWDGKSKGTQHTMRLAYDDGKLVYWYRPGEEDAWVYDPRSESTDSTRRTFP